MPNPDNHAVEIERIIRAPRELVFRALTEAEHLEQWFFTSCTTDPRPGGSYEIFWESVTHPEWDHKRWGNYLEFIPNEILKFEWCGLDPEQTNGRPTMVTITLESIAEGTRLRLVHTGFSLNPAGVQSRDSHGRGWNFYGDNIKSVLEDGKDLRRLRETAFSGQRLPRRVFVEKIIAASPAVVFRALTDAQELQCWFMTKCETDPRPGGKYAFIKLFKDSGKPDWTVSGIYEVVIPNRQLRFTWNALKHDATDPTIVKPNDPHPTVVEITLEALPGGTRVRLMHTGQGTGDAWDEALNMQHEGWTYYLKNLQSVLESGRDFR